MCTVSNYVGKGNISEEIVEVSSVFINFLFKRRDVLLPYYQFIYIVIWLYTKVIYWAKEFYSIGLFGFVFDIQILTSIVWKCIFLFSVSWTLTAVFVFRLYEERDEPLPFIFKLIGIIPTLPLYYGLYKYAK